MTWYDSNYKRRMPIAVDGSAHTGASAQVSFNVPSDWDDFWENIRSDGKDIVVTDKLGNKSLFEKGFIFSSRTLSINVHGFLTPDESSIHLLWLYWDYSDESVDHETTVTIVSALSGYIYLGAPFGRIVSGLDSTNYLTTVPTNIFSKDPDEQVDVWFPYTQLLSQRSLPYNEKLDYKAIQSLHIQVLDSSGANQTSLYDQTDTRIINGWVRVRIKSGSIDNDYVIRLHLITSDDETYVQVALLQVRKILPT
tara:strand:+ start:9257 stop:10012 length:756 start_codon:yes stop_codon:yes gene_type:complete